ncbi:CcmD family protein [Fulvivirgaceae bacterium LMO-SS25]
MKHILTITIFILILNFSALAQKMEVNESDYSNTQVEMADTFRKEGKIYTVVAIVGTVMAGIFIYAFFIDRRLARLEKELKM